MSLNIEMNVVTPNMSIRTSIDVKDSATPQEIKLGQAVLDDLQTLMGALEPPTITGILVTPGPPVVS